MTKRTLTLACLALLAMALMLLPGSAHADSEVRSGANWVRLTALPCATPAVLAILDPKVAGLYRSARAFVGGQSFQACWRADFKVKQVFVIYEDRDYNIFRFDELVPVTTL